MKTNIKGFVILPFLIIVAVVLVGGGIWVYQTQIIKSKPALMAQNTNENPVEVATTTQNIATTTEDQQAATSTLIAAVDTSGWQTYRNENYGFEFKYPSTFKLCATKYSYSNSEQEGVARFSGVNQDCVNGDEHNYKPIDLIVIEREIAIEKNYSDLADLEKALKGVSQIDNMFVVDGIGLFVVGSITENKFNGIPFLTVAEGSPAGYGGSIGNFVFHNGKFLNIQIALDGAMDRNEYEITKKDINAMFSTFKFVNPQINFNSQAVIPLGKRAICAYDCGSNTVIGAGGLTYGAVLGPDCKCWLDRNLGATQVAISAIDENAYGYYYQWGRPTDGHQVGNSATTSVNSSDDIPGHGNFITPSLPNDTYVHMPYDWHNPQNDNLWQGANGINNPCPVGWRVPTEPEWVKVISFFSPQTSEGAFNSALKIPLSGSRDRIDGTIRDRGNSGWYWSSSPMNGGSLNLFFGPGSLDTGVSTSRAEGFSIRCIKD